MPTAVAHYAPLVGRFLLALIFLLSGLSKIGGFAGTSQQMADAGMPSPDLLLVGAIVFEIAGALMIMSGFKAHYGALLLMIFLIPATVIFHNPAGYEGEEQQMQIAMLLKNLSILGGLIFLLGTGPGPLSLDNLRSAPNEA